MGSIFVLLNAYSPTRVMVAVPCMDERTLALYELVGITAVHVQAPPEAEELVNLVRDRHLG
jgi:vacuolar-type H+-ATPase subunit F/Vma7